jgi:2-methylisocitrate lyase-like PEP mutase family enzyme
MKKATVLRKAIMERRAVVVPGCHDALSAKVIEKAGFEAIQISGYGLAGAFLAKPDVGLVRMKDVLDLSWNITQAVGIPVMADIDTGGGNAVNATWITERLIAMGLAGMNIEDQVFPKRCGHMAGKEVITAEEMVGKIRACAEVRNNLDKDFIINARTDSFASLGLDEAIKRCNLYLDAGADLAFIDGIRTKADIEKALKALKGPISVNLMDAVSGVKTELIPIPELARYRTPIEGLYHAHQTSGHPGGLCLMAIPYNLMHILIEDGLVEPGPWWYSSPWYIPQDGKKSAKRPS